MRTKYKKISLLIICLFFFAIVKDIEVSNPYTKSSSSGYTSLKIGSASQTLLGDHTYTIKYKYYILGRDGLEDADEFYFNIIGTEWDTSIDNATFKITMPKEFDSSLLGFSSGYKGSKDSSNVQYSVDGNVITGSIKSPLKSSQGVTIRLTLPDEYFFNIITLFEKIIKFIIKQYMKIILCIGALFLIIILLGMFALAILYFLMSKRTNYGTEILGQIKGFRRFLENAEKGQLETLVEENPEYFYDILPYTYALGVSKKWIKQFETIAISPPD